MLYQPWHKRVIAYRLEDGHNNCPFFYDGHKAMLPDGYLFGYMNPSIFRESCYKHYYDKMGLYEYVLIPSVLVYDTGEVLFKPDQVLSKSRIRR